ncbi:MAG: enoyl-CoA hydratase/isomerase family protein [Deltaproteobacteria bacterium]|nr:enoyl-CoA hydratase/isomerase family protein [Deltaproteobacteria bacterium]
MAIIEWKKEGTSALLVMNNGENRHNLAFAGAMLDTFASIMADPSVDNVVIVSSDPRCWSLGVDVDWVTARYHEQDFQSIKAFLYRLNDLFKTMLTFPLPLIAAINGHVAANGLVLACACDFRFMRSDKGFARFPEIDLGIPFLPGMIAITKKALPRHFFEMMKYTAMKVTARELETHHVLVRSFENEELLIRGCIEFGQSLKKKRAILGEMKKRMNQDIIDVIEGKDPPFIESMALMV